MDKVATLYHQTLWTSDGALGLDYLRNERGFSDETIKLFNLGYCPTGYLETQVTPTEKHFLTQLKHFKGDKLWDMFSGRVVFPITQDDGTTLGFSGRLLNVGDRTDKYLNTPTNMLFKKVNHVFGIAQARRNIFLANNAIICEGFTDAVSAHQAGFGITVAAMGTRFTEHQLLRIARYSMNLTLMFDSDAAGEATTQRSIEMATSMGFTIKTVSLEPGTDPDDFFRNK